MGCGDSPSWNEWYRAEAEQKRIDGLWTKIHKLEQRNDYLVQMLCRTCKKLDKRKSTILKEDNELLAWWIDHKDWDKSQGRI